MNLLKIFGGEFEGRKVEILRYESGELRVVTIRKETEFSSAGIFPEGHTIFIDAQTPNELETELQSSGSFSSIAAKEISNLAR